MAAPLPTIDMAPLFDARDSAGQAQVARAIDAACRDHGFFVVTGHGIAPAQFDAVESAARQTFALPEPAKAAISMAHGGRAWRGWFPLGGELTSGRPDGKEGLYFGEELGADDPRVTAGWPLHGFNLWPQQVPALRPAVTAYMTATTRAAHALAGGIALALGLPFNYFAQAYTAQPTLLFRIFRYPPDTADGSFGVGEHTDYGFLTLLAQDAHPGLQVRTARGWIDVPALPQALVVNIGDMLDRLTGGRYRSTPHRVVNRATTDRLSWPLFFDPAFDAQVVPLPGIAVDADGLAADRAHRWDGSSVHAPLGRYGDYLLGKVGKVFPGLAEAELASTGKVTCSRFSGRW